VNNYLSEIRSVNLSYLMIAAQMIKHDKAEAIFRLGIDIEIADIIANMSNSQLFKLASSNIMLARFRFDDSKLLAKLIGSKHEGNINPSHAAIIMSGQEAETIV
jgi:flagellar transcriptional activator FlhD